MSSPSTTDETAHTHAWRKLILVILLPAAVATVTVGSDFGLQRSTIDSGGSTSSSGGIHELSGTIAQHDAGFMTGGAFALTSGFWFQQMPADCNCDGIVDLHDYNDFVACLFGPSGGLANASCVCFDFDADGDVDLADAGGLLREFDH